MRALNIFDFDCTLTKKHTFNDFRLEHYIFSDNIIVGQNAADGFKKSGIERFLKHDSQQVSAVATSHNNPDFIAGFIGQILNKKFTLIRTDYLQKPTTTAVNYYEVEGTEAPFLISYLPKYDQAFQSAIAQLKATGKNCQINALRDIYLKNQWVSAESDTTFFDDTKENYEEAKKLPQMIAHLIDPNKPQFSVIESFKSLDVLAPQKPLKIESSPMFFGSEVPCLGSPPAYSDLNLEHSSASAGP